MERKLSKHTWPCVKKLLNQANITPYLIDSRATPGSKWVYLFIFFLHLCWVVLTQVATLERLNFFMY